MTIRFENLHKSYDDLHVLHGINFEVKPGEPMAFLGRNGAGKTTTIRGFMDVFKFDEGKITIDGKPFERKEYKIGYLPEERGLYGKSKILDQLMYFAELKGIKAKAAKDNIMELLEKVELQDYANKKLETLSKGNQQKVQIIQALMNNPDIIILDEPFSGLDPINSGILKDMVMDLARKGKYMLFSSHQMGYVEEMCTDLVIINNGDIVVSGKIKDIKNELGMGRIAILADDMDRSDLELYLKSQFDNLGIENIKDDLVITLKDMSKSTFLQELLNINVNLKKFADYEPTMYDIFIKAVGEQHE